MKKTEELIDVLDTLRQEVRSSSALAEEEAHVAVYVGKGILNLDAEESTLVLHSRSTVKRFFEAIGSPASTPIEITGISIDDDVKEALDAVFSTVDEL